MNLQDVFMLINMGSAMFIAFYVHITCFDFKLSPKWKLWVIFIIVSVAGEPLRQMIDNADSVLLNFFAVFTMYNFLPILLLASGSFWGKLYCFYLQAGFSFALTLFASFITQAFFEYDSGQYLAMWTALTFIFYLLYVFYMRKHGNALFRNLFEYIKGKMWAVFSLLPYLSFIIIKGVCFYDVPVIPKPITGDISYILFPIIIIGGLLALTASILTVQKRITDQSELKLAQSVISSGHEYYDKLTAMTENLQRQRHDHKFQLRSVQTLLENGNDDDAKRYLETLTAKLEETFIKDYCHSRVINAMLSSCEDRCTEDGTQFFVQIEMDEDLPVNEYELSIIVGNLLENAVTACRRTPEGERRYIDVVMRRHDQSFGIMVENSYDGVIKRTPTGLASTKTDTSEPVGLGLDSIMAVAKKNNGEYIPTWDDKKFSAFVVMKLES